MLSQLTFLRVWMHSRPTIITRRRWHRIGHRLWEIFEPLRSALFWARHPTWYIELLAMRSSAKSTQAPRKIRA
jgi:hypothetical protein